MSLGELIRRPLERVLVRSMAAAGLALLAIGLAACASRGAGASPPAPRQTSRPGNSPATGTSASSQAVPVRGRVTVFAAASLTDAFNLMKRQIETASPGAQIVLNFAGSPTLRTQLAQGARADVFASADTANMEAAERDGTIDGQPSVFAHNKIVVATPTGAVRVQALQDLAKPGVKVVIEQPAVPAGAYARQVLDNLSTDPAYGPDYASKVLANVVSQEPDVRAVLSRIELGEADAGLMYVSDAGSPGARDRVKTIPVPDEANVIADYPLAPVRDAPNPAGGRAFIAYVLSPAGQAALREFGLLPAH